jgi:hypothetical protein
MSGKSLKIILKLNIVFKTPAYEGKFHLEKK